MGCGDWNDGMNLVGEKGLGAQKARLFAVGEQEKDIALRLAARFYHPGYFQRGRHARRIVRRARRIAHRVIVAHHQNRRQGRVLAPDAADQILNRARSGEPWPAPTALFDPLAGMDFGIEAKSAHALHKIGAHHARLRRSGGMGRARDDGHVGHGPTR